MQAACDASPLAIGLDGCRGRWLGALAWRDGPQAIRTRLDLFDSLTQVIELYPRTVLAVDTPIGLLDAPRLGGREADAAVRKALGKRAVCVFTPPCAPALMAATYRQAQAIQRDLAATVHARTGDRIKAGITVQGFNIFWAMRDATRVATPARVRAGQIFEVHPELSFACMQDDAATGGLAHPKKSSQGQQLRLQLLEASGFINARSLLQIDARPQNIAIDDILDAHAAAWSALRRIDGTARAFPPIAQEDPRGVPMQVWA